MLNCLIDQEMPGHPKFEYEEIHFSGESYDFYFWHFFPASAHSSVTQVLQGDSYLHLNVITKIQLAPHDSLVKCTLESGGGRCRYVKISLHIVYYLRAFSNPSSRTDQARQLYPSSYHVTRPNSHIFCSGKSPRYDKPSLKLR